MIPPLPSGVGALSPGLRDALASDIGIAVSSSFRDAFIEGVFRGLPLLGPLGGDLVHGWPPIKAEAYAQNWRSAERVPNSWGLDSLILAVLPVGGERACVVEGTLLDAYGRGEGIGAANGVAGYGAPVSDAFPYGDGIAQRFRFGLIIVAADGTRSFLQEEAPREADSPTTEIGVLSGAPPAGLNGESVGVAFRSAWRAAVARGLPPETADGPVRILTMDAASLSTTAPSRPEPARSEPAVASGDLLFEGEPAQVAPEPVRVEAVLLQTYGNESWALALPVGEGVGTRARLLASPILDFLRARGTWEAALAAYGAPLTDPFPRDGKTAQRFSLGWMETE